MTRETLTLFWRATWRHKGLLIASEIGNTIFVLTTEILPAAIVARIIDMLSGSAVETLHFSDFTPYLWLFTAVYMVRLLASRLTMQSYIRLAPSVIRDLEDMSFSKLQQHSLAFFSDNFSGALVAKVNRLSSAYQRALETTLFDIGQLVRRYIVSLIIVFFISPLIAVVFLGWTIVFCSIVLYLHYRKMHLSRAAAGAQTEVTARLADSITNTLTIRAFARSVQESRAFKRLTQKQRDLRYQSLQKGDQIRTIKGFMIFVFELIILILTVRLALDGRLSIGSIVLVQFYITQLLTVLWNVGRFMDRIEEALADASEMTAVIMQPHEVIDPPRPEPARMTSGSIAFRDVAFHYPDTKVALFQQLNLEIPAGQKVGLVGPSGSGKTTLTKLLLRFMDIDSGAIEIDGQNIAAITQEDLRRSIAYVAQEPLLFHRSIHDNIAYGRPDAKREEIIDAAERASASEFIQELPHDYQTVVGERGVKLSGGQRQRVAIARAMLKKAPILLLDEATSSLDSVSERLITHALDQLMGNRTTMVIAHRLSTIRKMDRILVLQEGRIIEDGTHEQLLGRKGLYAKLWAHQSGDFLGEA